ncbi:hypothetical protein ACG94X_14200 [Acinetobacter sp. ULE_I010]|uniref:hypothetical protein n=1 Tax=Acinetobacter sp. ULE_I010 TaxID=3373065 RepID=UPI003AF8AD8A
MSIEYELVKKAILEKKQIFAIYQGYEREMCPHVIGRKNRKEQALFYQFGGESSTGTIVKGSTSNWRCIRVNELDNVRIVDGPWHTADNHSRKQTCVDVIDAEVEI